MEPPTQLCEKYDVIHVQLFTTIIRNGDPLPVLRNLMKILSEYRSSSFLNFALSFLTDILGN